MATLRVGDICIWQNQIGELAYLNGTECTITGAYAARVAYNQFGNRGLYMCYAVDTKVAIFGDSASYALPTDLRLKNEPTPEAEQEYNALIERMTDMTTV
jgi:hypothetical protein